MTRARLDHGIELEYEAMGTPGDDPLLLIAGLSSQLIVWPDEFCELLVAAGHYVVRFDNRDAGLSTRCEGTVDVEQVVMAALAGGEVPVVPYLLSDMALDAVGLLDHLGIERAHVVGASMGGMIAQMVAIEHPRRCLSLVSIMSQPGELEVGQPTPDAFAVLLAPPPRDRAEFIEGAMRTAVWHSRKYHDPERLRREAARSYDRAFFPEGGTRQLAAIFASGRRSTQLSQLDIPTLVIHGRDDALVDPSGGVRTAEVIPGANLLLVAHMGHDLPEPLWPILTDAIISHTRHASARGAGDRRRDPMTRPIDETD